MMSAYSIRIFGRVFGVGFRRYVFRYANENQILGFVENDWENDCVHIEAQGNDDNLHRFIMLCEQGTPYSVITYVKIIPKTVSAEYKAFEQIR